MYTCALLATVCMSAWQIGTRVTNMNKYDAIRSCTVASADVLELRGIHDDRSSLCEALLNIPVVEDGDECTTFDTTLTYKCKTLRNSMKTTDAAYDTLDVCVSIDGDRDVILYNGYIFDDCMIDTERLNDMRHTNKFNMYLNVMTMVFTLFSLGFRLLGYLGL